MDLRGERLYYLDNLRLLIIVFVVMHHLAVIYSGFGDWFYYLEKRHLDILSTIWFAFYLAFQQGYFMGFLFMIAGYFAAGSYDRKGFGRFVGDRFKRLMIPALIYMVVITPFIFYVEVGRVNWLQPKLGLIHIVLIFLSGVGVMWFAVALFIFTLIYGLVRLCGAHAGRNHVSVSNGKQIQPSLANAVILILIISGSAFLIRIVQPIGTNILNMQICFFASYIALFIVGIMAYRNNLFNRISYQAGKNWLICGIVLGLFVWLGLVIMSRKSGNLAALYGGFTWESAGYSLWESFVAVAMSMGLIAVFRKKLNYQNKLVKTMVENSFAVYMFHPPITVAAALLFKPFALLPIVKWILLCIVCVPLCFSATHFIFRKVPLLKNVL
jgi:Fucose 4-O-acetylase and related acetyltransferases